MDFVSQFLNVSILHALLSGAACAYITYLLVRRSEENNKFKNYFHRAMEHANLANFYWKRGKVQKAASEIERSADFFLKASLYANDINNRWCRILANNLFNQASIIRRELSRRHDSKRCYRGVELRSLKGAKKVNNDLVDILRVLSELEMRTQIGDEIKRKFMETVTYELEKLEDFKILL